MATISLQEAADQLGVHYMTVYRYVRHGRLPARKVYSQLSRIGTRTEEFER